MEGADVQAHPCEMTHLAQNNLDAAENVSEKKKGKVSRRVLRHKHTKIKCVYTQNTPLIGSVLIGSIVHPFSDLYISLLFFSIRLIVY